MRRMIAVCVIAVVFALAGLAPASAHGRVDQQHGLCGTDASSSGNIETFSPMGQSFKPGVSRLFAVDLCLEDLSTDNDPTVLRVRVREGTISGTVVAEDAETVPDGTKGWWHFDFVKKTKVVVGDTYVIQISVDTPSMGVPPSHQFGASLCSGEYADGTRIERGIEVIGDLCFRTYGTGK